jgi:tetratricopeptide (TPR) repeat protein
LFLFCLPLSCLLAQKTSNGWSYEESRSGRGPNLRPDQGALTHNQLIDANGNILVSTYQIGVPDYQLISELSPAFQQALTVMQVGGKYRFVIPINDFKAAAKSPAANRLSGDHVIWEMELLEVLPPKPDGARLIAQIVEQQGIDAAFQRYQQLISSGEAYFGEWEANQVGYLFLQKGASEKAIKVLAYNTKRYPNSANAHDSLAEAYYAAGMKEEARVHYQKSLSINPDNSNARKMLGKL